VARPFDSPSMSSVYTIRNVQVGLPSLGGVSTQVFGCPVLRFLKGGVFGFSLVALARPEFTGWKSKSPPFQKAEGWGTQSSKILKARATRP
jgi:hypothetical protein